MNNPDNIKLIEVINNDKKFNVKVMRLMNKKYKKEIAGKVYTIDYPKEDLGAEKLESVLH